MAKTLPTIQIKIDSREQQPWDFQPEEKKSGRCQVTEIITEKLDAGDYSIIGLEDKVLIERKKGWQELFLNYSPKENKARFEREMERMRDVPHKYILIESLLDNDTLGLSIPQMKFAPPAKRVLEWLLELQLEYGIHIMFVGNSGKQVARKIFEKVAKRYL